jgi:hypothetical protein
MRSMKQVMKAVLAAGIVILGLGVLEKAEAVTNPDTMTVSVTPNVTYGVQIGSVNAGGYQFGLVSLSGTTVSTAPVTLTNSGNIAEYFSMAISNSTGSWTAVAGSPAADQFRMIAELAANQPGESTGFVAGDALANPPVPTTAATLYANGGAQSKTNPAANQKMWMRLEMPTGLSAGSAATEILTLTVNGQGA